MGFVGNLLGFPSVKEFWKSVKNWQSYCHEFGVQFFWPTLYDNPMTLKCRLRVTQGHWKRNYWVDHTRLTISRVIGRWILSWPWNVGQRSLRVIEISAIRKPGCGFIFGFYSNYGRICSRLWNIQCQRMAWPGKTRLGVVQCHWKWRRTIDHLRLSVGRPLQI